MLSIADDGRLQVTSGLALLETSKLVEWDWDVARFTPVTFDDFECTIENFDATFGRVISWIIFSAGAEFLAKGVCLLSGVENIRRPDCVMAYPPVGTDMTTWALKVQKGFLRTEPIMNFGQIGSLYHQHLRALCKKVDAEPAKRNQILAAYELLGTTIRNRDAHAYVHTRRASHFYLVPELFLLCLNDLLSWTQLPACELNNWRKDAPQFIDGLAQAGDQNLSRTICDEVATRKKKLKLIPKRLQDLVEDDLDRVIKCLDQLGASKDEE